MTKVMTARPPVRVNQVGYLPNRPKHATLVSDAKDPVHFTVRDQSGLAVYTGLSEPWSVRPEPTSGLMVHVLDFSDLTIAGAGFRIEATGQRSHLFEITGSLYDMMEADALRFFYPMRSGTPILDSVAPGYGRPAGHLGRPPNRGDLEVPAWMVRTQSSSTPPGGVRAHSMSRAAGMTRAITASTSRAAPSLSGSCSAHSSY